MVRIHLAWGVFLLLHRVPSLLRRMRFSARSFMVCPFPMLSPVLRVDGCGSLGFAASKLRRFRIDFFFVGGRQGQGMRIL